MSREGYTRPGKGGAVARTTYETQSPADRNLNQLRCQYRFLNGSRGRTKHAQERALSRARGGHSVQKNAGCKRVRDEGKSQSLDDVPGGESVDTEGPDPPSTSSPPGASVRTGSLASWLSGASSMCTQLSVERVKSIMGAPPKGIEPVPPGCSRTRLSPGSLCRLHGLRPLQDLADHHLAKRACVVEDSLRHLPLELEHGRGTAPAARAMQESSAPGLPSAPVSTGLLSRSPPSLVPTPIWPSLLPRPIVVYGRFAC